VTILTLLMDSAPALGCWKGAERAQVGSAMEANAGLTRGTRSKKAEGEQEDQGRGARLPSTGVKRSKKTKRANALVTFLTYMTLWTFVRGLGVGR
jgi:hypothetical protein